MKKLTFLMFAPLSIAAFMGCATTAPPPQELVAARAAYARAQQSGGSRLALVEMHAARQDLDRAESAYLNAPDAPETRDLSYIALRRAATAEARGSTMAAEETSSTARVQREAITGQRLAQAQNAVAQQQSTIATERQARSQTEQQLTAERAARQAAEARAHQAIESLRAYVAVANDQRGTVITLSGEVLFASGQATLLPTAQDRLNQVATALREQGESQRIRVEGHTDSRGSAITNQALSLARASAVRDYLVSRGLTSANVDAVGLGPSRPIADNESAEGRANNRRVEIVISPQQQ